MKKALVLDIDGVILYSAYIFKEIFELDLHGDAKWAHFYDRCNSTDTVLMSGICELINAISKDPEMTLLVSTSRSERCRQGTELKLAEYGINVDKIYMRDNNDYRPSPEVKREHLIEIRKEYNIIAFIDDEIANCNMARDLGILALRRV